MKQRLLRRTFSSDLAIDLGTANTLVYMAGKGIVVNEPSVVAVDRHTGETIGCGSEAKQMLGRAPAHVAAIRPMREGVIANFDMAERMLSWFVRKANGRNSLMHPRVVIGIPSDTTEVQKRAVLDSTHRAKAAEVHLVEQSVATALGAGLPVTEPHGNLIVDIGAGTTDLAIVSLSGTSYSRSLRVAGNQMDDAIIQYMKNEYNLLIGERSAERVKIEIGSALPLERPLKTEVKGRDLIRGLPKAIVLNDSEICRVLSDCVSAITNAIGMVLDHTAPELSGDISDRGITLTGGGSLLRRLDEKIRMETKLPVCLTEDPLTSGVIGSAKVLGDSALLRKMSLN